MHDDLSINFELFKNRKVKASDIFIILEISKNLAYEFVKEYHYLGDAKFFCQYAYGLWCEGELCGVATYCSPQGTSTLKGWFGLPNNDLSVLELSRLCMLPELNGTNATSYLLGNSIKMLKRYGIRAVITLADASRHVGSIYQVCNFKYYGLTNEKNDFYRYPDGLKNPRGKVSQWRGVWLPRTRKHRYAFILDKSLTCLYQEQAKPTIRDTIERRCCDGWDIVYDNRNQEWFSCPICSNKLELINNDE